MTAHASSQAALPTGGIGIVITHGSKQLGNIAEGAPNRALKIETTLDAPALQELLPTEEDTYRNLVIAKVNNYVNVRSIPDETGEVLGKLYDKSAGEFLGEENGWYKISSGDVTGYVKAEYCVTGDDAVELAKEVGTHIATVTTFTLKVRCEPSIESKTLTLIPMDEELEVLDETDGWVQVDVQEGTGWVSKDYVDLRTEFVQAESKEQEAKRLAKEEEERRKAREAADKAIADKKAKEAKDKKKAEAAAIKVPSSGDSDMGAQVAEYALQFVGNPYVYGGTSLTKGADCSGFVMSVYANFGVSLPHSSASDRSQGYAVDSIDNAIPGDLICYSGHVALYIGNGKIVHASTRKTGIIVSDANIKKILAIRRIF